MITQAKSRRVEVECGLVDLFIATNSNIDLHVEVTITANRTSCHTYHLSTMRIHLELDPSRVLKTTSKGSSNAAIAAQPKLLPGQSAGGPLLKLGLTPDGQEDVVLIELQGELTFEGDSGGRTIGLLGFERPVSAKHGSQSLS